MEVPWRVLILFTILCVVSSFASSSCESKCSGAGGPFVEGQLYKYQLDGSTTTHLPGSEDQVTSLGISATAEIFAESKCQHILKLSNVQVKGPDGKKYNGLAADCAKPIKFSYNNGKLTELCGENNDRGAGLNIKRAVISLVSSLRRNEDEGSFGYEHDVFGICPTEFTFSKEGSKVTIHKTKDLNRCSLREAFNFPFPTTPYQSSQSSFGAFETSPLLGAHLTVNQVLDKDVLQKATGEEEYTYRPLVNPEAGAVVKVSYTLTLKGASAGSIPASGKSPKIVFYESSHDDNGVKNHAAMATALQKATASIEPVATPEAAKHFANLVHVIEQGNKAEILQAYNAAQGKTAKNLFLDGLFYAGSADSVEAAAELLHNKQIPEDMAVHWYMDLNFVKHASRGSLTALTTLLSGKAPIQAYLGIGAVAGKFCLEHRNLCETGPEFKALQAKLAEPLAKGCKVTNHEQENLVIASLKGLGNSRHLSDDVAHKVVQCATDKTAKSRVRVAAIEAFHADAGKSAIKQAATSILKDVEEDSELRIKAYLALVESPCPKVADTVKELVDNEPINQVGSFVVSHLRNLRASVSPDKEVAKEVLGNIISKKKYPIDQRKFSKNYEVSYSLDAINVGAVGEVNRIFSQKSFIPRSVSLNLTTQIFGHSLNFAEIGLRAENLEWYFEKYFGPVGALKSKGAKFMDEFGEQAEETVKKAKEKIEAVRPKRAVSKQEADAATNKVQLGPDYEDHYTDLDLSLKLFGSDVIWYNHHDKISYEEMKKKLHDHMDETLDKSKNIDIDYKKARRFLDAGLTYPTGLGFGLKVHVDGSSAVNVKVNGKMDAKAIANHPSNAHIAFQVVPSGTIELSSLLSVDAHVVETGVKVSANIHSSTGSDLTIKVLDGYGIDVKLGLPVKKQDILNFNSDVVSIVRENKEAEVETPIKFNVKRQEHGGCFDQLSPLIGLTFCGEFSIPLEGVKVLSPAYGPSKASLRIEKDDESLTTYHFKAFYNHKQQNQMSIEVLLDTPNSKTNRKFALTVQGTLKPKKQLLINFISPFKQATFEGLVIDSANEQSILVRLESEGDEYSLRVGATVSGDANRKKYEPLLEYKYPEAPKSDRAWIGRKGAAKGGRAEQKTLGVTGAVYVEKTPNSDYRKYELKEVSLTSPKFKLTVDGTITVDNNLVATDLKASYEKETLTLNSKVQKLEGNKYIAKIEFSSSQYPDLGGSIKWEYERSPTKLENKLVVVHGPDLKSEVSRLSLAQLFTYKYESIKVFEFSTENSVSYPLLAVSAAIKGSVTPKSLQYDVEAVYDKNEVKSKLDAKAGTKHPTDYSVDFKGQALGNSVDFTSKHERISATKSKFTNSLEMKPGGKYQLNGVAELNSKPGDIYQFLEAELKLPQDPKNVKVKTEIKHNNKEEKLNFVLTGGNKPMVDLAFEILKKAEPSGKYKLSLPKYVESTGAFDTKNKKSTGSFQVNIVKTGRVIEGKGEFVKTGTQFKGSGDILWDAKKDPNKKIHIKTETDISGKSIDTKNIFQVLDLKTEVNVKGNIGGTLYDGTMVGDVEIVLPSGQVLAAKVNRKVQYGADSKIEGTYELSERASKSAAPHKVVLKLNAKNINIVKMQLDGQADLTYSTPTNQDIVIHLVGKKMPEGNKWIVFGQGSVTGSLVKHPLHAKLNADVSDQLMKAQLTADKKFPPGQYDFELKVGNDFSLNANGKMNLDQLNNELKLKLPADLPVTSLQWKSANTLNIFVAEAASRKIQTDNEVHWNGNSFVKYSYDGIIENDGSHGKMVWESHKHSARTLTYKAHMNKETRKIELDLALQYEGKTADIGIKADGSANPIHLHVVSNVPDHGKYEVDLAHLATDGGYTRETTVSASGNGKALKYHSKYSMSKTSPYLDINLDLPEGKTRIYGKLDRKGENHVLVESKISWFTNGGGDFDMNGEVNVKSMEDFAVKLSADSPKLNLNKVELEAKTAGKSVSFHGKSGDKEISGNMALTSKGTLPNVEYDGKGEMKIGDKTYPVELKFKNEMDKDQRKHETDVDIKMGKYSLTSHTVAERDDAISLFKLNSLTKYCNEKGCKTDEIKMHSQRNGLDFETTNDIKLDVSTHYFLEHPLLLKNHLKKDGFTYNSNYELEYGSDKLQYQGYIDEKHAGIELTLPKRVIAAEVKYDIYVGKNLRVEGNFWLDKKNAADKTSIVITGETTHSPDGTQSTSEVHITSPGLKELSVKGNLNINTRDRTMNAKIEADVFAKKNQKLVAEYKAALKNDKDSYSANDYLHIHSKGLNTETRVQREVSVSKTSFNYFIVGQYTDSKQARREAIAKISVDPKAFVALLKVPEGIIYYADLSIEKKDNNIHSKGHYEILGHKFEEEFEMKGSRVKLSLIQKTKSNAQLDLDFGFTVGQVAEVSGKFNKKPLASLEIALDEAHFLKTKHSYDTDVAKDLLKVSKETSVELAKEGSKIFKETGAKLAHEINERVDIYHKALPNFKPAVQHYQKELEEMKKEFTSNQNVKHVIDFLKNTFGAIFTQISTIFHEISDTVERLITIFNEAVQKITESVKVTITKLKEQYEKTSELLIDSLEEILKQVTALINTILDKIKEHQKDIDELTSVVTDFLHDFGQIIGKTVGELQKDIKDFINIIWEQLQALPAYNMLKEKLQELKNFKIPQQYWDTYHEAVTSFAQLLPTPELQQLLKSLTDYFEKIVKQQPINSAETLQQLYKELFAAVKSVIAIIEAYKPSGIDKSSWLPSNLFLPRPSFSMLVAPPGTFRFSLINWIQSSDLPTASDIFHTYRPRHCVMDVIPPFKASATLAGGTEFFTFDKKHYSFKGSCSYILSKDVIDGNFTLVANMEGGKLKSIAAFDHKNGVELLHDNSVLFNGKPRELPIHEGDLHLFSKFEAGVHFATHSGVKFFCTPHLKHCAFEINGFYFGKTRGLLGTYNYEPYDDATTPAGKVSKSLAEFANSWKVNPQCADGVVHEQVAPQAEECSKLFAGDSSLRMCFDFENPEPFRESCNRKVAESTGDKQEQACNIAQVYVGYCNYVHLLMLRLPEQCGKCQVGSQSLQIGETTSIKAPQKQADVVFVVEQVEQNEEVYKQLITPLVTSLTNDLKEKGITDVKFALIGFGAPDQMYPAVYTVHGKYNEFTGTASNIYFAKQSEVTEPKLSDRLEEIKHRIEIETGTTKGGMAMKEAFNYPFRPEAVKTVVGVVASTCDHAVLPFQSARLLLARLNMLSSGVVVHLVTPLNDLKVEGKDEKTTANIVGFDSDLVYTQSEAKRKVLKGDEEAHKNLKYTSDVCTDMALGVNGAVFSSTNFVKGKPNFRKNFIQVLSNKITDSLTSETLTEECRCVLEYGMIARTKCKVVSREEKKGGAKG